MIQESGSLERDPGSSIVSCISIRCQHCIKTVGYLRRNTGQDFGIAGLDIPETNSAFQESGDGHLVGGVEKGWGRATCAKGGIGESKAGEALRIWAIDSLR